MPFSMDLAKLTGLSSREIQLLEYGYKSPLLQTVIFIQRALDVNFPDLIEKGLNSPKIDTSYFRPIKTLDIN